MLNGLRGRHLLFFCLVFFESNLLFATSSSNSSQNSLSKTSRIISIFPQLPPILTFTTGATISKLGQSQSFQPLDLCQYHYKPKNSTSSNLLWGGFVGFEVRHALSWSMIVGLGYYQPNMLSTKGALTQGADPISSNTYNYQYQTQSQQWLAEAKWVYWRAHENIQPFLMAGIGTTFNKTFHYQTTVPPFLEFTPVFSSLSQTNFTYAIGPGLDIGVSKSVYFGIAYRFTDLGLVRTGSAKIDEIPIASTLKQPHLYANQILLQFTFIPWTKG